MTSCIELKKKALQNIVKQIKSLENQAENLKKENLDFPNTINIKTWF